MKQFYTEKDIEELFKSGTRSLRVNDDLVLTDLAYEQARRLGLQLIFEGAETPPLAPVRPYLSQASMAPSVHRDFLPDQVPLRTKPQVDSVPLAAPAPPAKSARREEVAGRIRAAVSARLGNQVDAKLLDRIIERVLTSTGVK